jgi:hypothetical protein
MSDSNPTYTASDVISDVEGRLSSPNINTSIYLPWISYAYNRLWGKLANIGQHAKEAFFADTGTISLDVSTLEHTITDDIPRFGSLIRLEVQYGGSGDLRVRAYPLKTVANVRNLGNVSTNYYPKGAPRYYIAGGKLGIVPVPPESGATAYLRYVKRVDQITDAEDVIDIPYRFVWPIAEYVHAKAIQRVNEDYSIASGLEDNFRQMLEEVADQAAGELSNENDGTNFVEEDDGDGWYANPLDY